MSLRFLIGSCVSAVVNFGIALIFCLSHDAMAQNPTWDYVLIYSWSWKIWVGWFFVAGLAQLLGILKDSARCVRASTGVGIVAKALWTCLFTVVLFDPVIRNVSGMAQWLTGAVMAFELVFLALPNTPRLDDIVRKNVTKEQPLKQVA